jgi:hypothetical protein
LDPGRTERASGSISELASPLYSPEDHEVTFTVVEGVVTLAGRVRFSGEVAVVTGMAWEVPGVVHVVNNVTFELADGT